MALTEIIPPDPRKHYSQPKNEIIISQNYRFLDKQFLAQPVLEAGHVLPIGKSRNRFFRLGMDVTSLVESDYFAAAVYGVLAFSALLSILSVFFGGELYFTAVAVLLGCVPLSAHSFRVANSKRK